MFSWDTGANTYDTNETDGRSYISCVSEIITDANETCEGRAKNTMGEARMDIVSSEMGYLGYHDSESYGLTWKVRYPDLISFEASKFRSKVVKGHRLLVRVRSRNDGCRSTRQPISAPEFSRECCVLTQYLCDLRVLGVNSDAAFTTIAQARSPAFDCHALPFHHLALTRSSGTWVLHGQE